MNCPKCNAPLPEGSSVCLMCGTDTKAEEAQEKEATEAAEVKENTEAEEANVNTEVEEAAEIKESEEVKKPEIKEAVSEKKKPAERASSGISQEPQVLMKKNKYVAKTDNKKVKGLGIATRILTLICIAVTAFSVYTLLNTSIEKIPVVALVLDIISMEEDVNDLREDINEAITTVEASLKQIEAETSEEDYEKLEKLIECGKDVVENTSLLNFNKAIKHVTATVDEEMIDEFPEVKQIYEMVKEAGSLISLIVLIVICMFAFTVLFSLLGGIFLVRGLVITGMIFTVTLALPFIPIAFVAAILVIHIVMICLINIINNEYDTYKWTFRSKAAQRQKMMR